jgi:hypothetical protein
MGMQVMASLNGDSEWDVEFEMPPSLPTGTAKLRLRAQANANTGAAKINPLWASFDPGTNENPDTITLTAETTSTITWSTGNEDDDMEVKITLDADTIVAGECIKMHIRFETSSWTLAQVSTWVASIIWE